jgi:hypothetical protein
MLYRFFFSLLFDFVIEGCIYHSNHKMNAAVKSQLKQRTKDWNAQQKKGFVNAEDMLNKKCDFLEDVLALYCEEIERLSLLAPPSSSSKANAMTAARLSAAAAAGGGADTTGMLQSELATAISDTAHYYELYTSSQQEVKQLTDEVAFLRTEQARIVQKATEDFQRALARNNERHDQSMRLVVQESEMDRSRLSALEAELLQFRSDRDAQTAEEVMVAQNHIEGLEHELSTVRRELAAEHRRVVELERELASSKRRVAHATDFMMQMETLSERVIQSMVKEAASHKRLVDSLLMSEDAVGETQSENERHRGDNNGSTLLRGGKMSTAAEDEQRARILQKLSTNLNSSGTGGAVSATERLHELLKQWEGEGEAQQLELAVAARCANDQHQAEQRKMQAKLMESFGHCEVLVQRIQQQDKQQAELKEFLASERDKALDARDRAVVMVRAIEQANTRRAVTASVGVQTIRSETTR